MSPFSVINNRLSQTLHWVLSPILAFGIYLTAINLGKTYESVERFHRESIWSLVHLNTQLQAAGYEMQMYLTDTLTEKELRVRYDLIWSKYLILQSSLAKDDMLKQVSGLKQVIEDSFQEIKAMENAIYAGDSIDVELIPKWIAQLSHAHETIHRYLLHEVLSENGSYSKASRKKVLGSLYFVIGSCLIFFLHIGYLMFILVKERSDSHFQLSHDSLTGLASRKNTMQMLEQYCQRNSPFSLVIIDLNEFKKVNDNHGHLAGDHVLRHLAEVFRNTLALHGLIGRLGGDEFVWIITETDRELIARYYNDLLEALKQPCPYEQNIFMIKLSAGATLTYETCHHPKNMLSEADKAMYKAKQMRSEEIIWFSSPECNTPSSATPFSILL